MKQFRIIHLLPLLLLVFLFSGCSRDNGSTPTSSEARYLSIKGSDTMVHLVSAWAEGFMKLHPDSDLSVTGGGSGTGIAALLNGTTDICAASRKIKGKEMELAAAKSIKPLEISVAIDGIAVIVNPANPLSQLSIEELGKIFTGAVTNWKQLGGPDQPIIVLSRESSSGTFVYFQERVLDKQDYAPSARFLPGTSAIIQNIAADKWTIGYVGLGYVVEAGGRIKALAVAEKPGGIYVAPSEETVKNGSYPISRPLFFYVNEGYQGSQRQAFISYALSAAGQKIVSEAGYVPVGGIR